MDMKDFDMWSSLFFGVIMVITAILMLMGNRNRFVLILFGLSFYTIVLLSIIFMHVSGKPKPIKVKSIRCDF